MKYLKITALLVFILPSLALAAGPQVTEPGFLDSLICVKDVKNCQLTDVAAGFNSLIKLLLGGMGAVALLYFVIGGFKWVTSRGNQQQVRDGQQMMVNTVFALVIAFTSYLVLSFFVNDVLQVDTDYKISGTQSTNPGDSTGECVGQEIGTPCNTSSLNYVCSGGDLGDQCITKCALVNIIPSNTNNNGLSFYGWSFACNNISTAAGAYYVSDKCPGDTSNVCILYDNGTPILTSWLASRPWAQATIDRVEW